MDNKPTPPTPSAPNSEIMEKVYSVALKQKEWVVIYNIMASGSYKLGDAKVINPILDTIYSIAAVDTNIPEEKVKVS